MSGLFELNAKAITGKNRKLKEFAGSVVLVVNTASNCGFTPQYKGLEALYQRYKDQGLVILGFPSNEFGQQEPGEDKEIAQFCELNFGVTFPLFGKVQVNGEQADPVFKFLKARAPGLLGSEGIKWNFTKFLVGRDGQVIKRFAPQLAPADLAKDIETALGASQ
jgi:glutathione peroxidase